MNFALVLHRCLDVLPRSRLPGFPGFHGLHAFRKLDGLLDSGRHSEKACWLELAITKLAAPLTARLSLHVNRAFVPRASIESPM